MLVIIKPYIAYYIIMSYNVLLFSGYFMLILLTNIY